VIAVVDAFAFGGINDIPGSPKDEGAEVEEESPGAPGFLLTTREIQLELEVV
jgi:hypothetical protein